MNILTDTLPEEITICGEKYPIHTDFRTWICFSQKVFSGSMDVVALAEVITLVIAGERLPPDVNSTISALLDFYTLQNMNDEKSQSNGHTRAFDFDVDAGHIYAAFLQQYNIDLTKVNMHWWTFKSLLDSISEETRFGKIIQYRCTDTSKIKDKETKKSYEKLKRIYALPDNRSDEDKEHDFADGLSMAF